MTTSDSEELENEESFDPLIGQVVDGRYQVVEVLGEGGVGVVYRAQHLQLARPVALKVLRREFGQLESLRRRFEREAQALSSLSHPNIVTVTDYGFHDGAPYLCMELLDGQPLDEILEERLLEPAIGIDVVHQALRAMAFAHERGILHRDLKPANIFLQQLPDDPHHVRLLDFGLAKLLVDEEKNPVPTLTGSGTIMGTPAYMSPEQATGARVTARSDVYSAGIVLFETLTGVVPFDEESRAGLVRAHMLEPPPDPMAVRPDLKLVPELQAILDKSLAKQPSDRYADAEEMLRALDSLPTPAAWAGDAPPDVLTTSARRLSRLGHAGASSAFKASEAAPPISKKLLFLIGALVLIGSAVGAFFAVSGGEELLDDEVAVEEVATGEGLRAEASTRPRTGPLAGELPPQLAPVAQKVFAGTPLDRAEQREARRLQREDKADPRPSLLLGRDMATRGWLRGAVQRYSLAVTLDPRAKEDDRILPDLIRIASYEHEAAGKARALIRDTWGSSALPAVEQALNAAEQRSVRNRLESFKRELEGGGS